MKLEAPVLCACALLGAAAAFAQSAFQPAAELQAAVRALPVQAGRWEVRRRDAPALQPFSKCMSAEDWERTKARALGLADLPPDCAVKNVVLRGNQVRTTFACREYSVLEETEFADGAFRKRAVEMPPELTKGVVVLDSEWKWAGAC